MPAYDVSQFSSCDEPEIIHQCSDSCLHVFQHEAYRSVSYCAVVRSSSRQKPIQNDAFSFFPSSKLSRILRKLRVHLFACVLPRLLTVLLRLCSRRCHAARVLRRESPRRGGLRFRGGGIVRARRRALQAPLGLPVELVV